MRSSRDAAGRDASVSRPDVSEIHQRFPRSCRLTARRQFREVYDHGQRVGASAFQLFGRPNDLGWPRIGLTATRRIGGAVKRNRVKRILREVFRLNRHRLEGSIDIVINARATVADQPFRLLERDFLRCFVQLQKKVAS